MTLLLRMGQILVELLVLPFLVVSSLSGRLGRGVGLSSVDVGLGPEPLLNHLSHKKALESCGYRAETFVDSVSYITGEFDIRADRALYGLTGFGPFACWRR